MEPREFFHILAAIIIFTAIGSFSFLIDSQWFMLPKVLLFATIIISVSIFAKKIIAGILDSDVEHEIWNVSRYGIIKHQRLNKEIPGGIIFPLLFSLFSLGFIKFAAFITYEARALKRRAAKRFGFYSFTELTEWHNGLIGAAGIISLFIIAIIAYFLPYGLEYFSKLAVYYAISNLIPISKLDGTQIFFGSKVLWTALALIALIFGAYAFAI
jgi:hypothetical protein